MTREKATLPCIVDDVVVDVVVCWPADVVAAVKDKWPHGVDIAALSVPGYEGMGSAAERGWLVRVARSRAARAAAAFKANTP